MKKLIFATFFLSFVSHANEEEMKLRMEKDFSMKEILNNSSLCNMYNSFIDKDKEHNKLSCPRVIKNHDSVQNNEENINYHVNFISNTSNEISDFEVKLIVNATLDNIK